MKVYTHKDVCAGCKKPIDPDQCLAQVGELDETGVTYHLTCFRLRELTPAKEMN